MSKSKRQLLQELLELENQDLGDVEEPVKIDAVKKDAPILINDCEDDNTPITKPKKQLTEKQLEALKKGQQRRDENRARNKLIKEHKEEQERKLIEEKLVKKAISIKKKQIKKQAVLDEISDDDTPIQKIKEISTIPPKISPPTPSVPKIMFV